MPGHPTRATRARGAKSALPVFEELHFRSENAFLCLLLNRRTRSIRAIDFRVGAFAAKRLFIQSIARRENVEKVILLVEKSEISNWKSIGFVREGTVPGFYRRSDAHLLGCVIGEKTASIEVTDGAQRLAERTMRAARKRSLDDSIRGVTVKAISRRTALQVRDRVWRHGDDALGSFDPFGRGASRFYLQTLSKRAKANYLSAEHQDCFGHSLVEVLRLPTTEADVLTVASGLRSLGEELRGRGIFSAFAFAPNDHVPLSTAFVSAGYEKTGLLARGVLTDGKRSDAILWTRRLADPNGNGEDPGTGA